MVKIGLFINIIQRSFRLTTLIPSLLETSTTSSRTRRGLHYLRRAAEPVDIYKLGALHEVTPTTSMSNSGTHRGLRHLREHRNTQTQTTVETSTTSSRTRRGLHYPRRAAEPVDTDNLGALHECTPNHWSDKPRALYDQTQRGLHYLREQQNT